MRFIDLEQLNVPNIKKTWAKKHLDALKELPDHKSRVEYLNKHPYWSKFKELLKETYGELCWYSECKLSGQFGDIDHFRPKSKSVDCDKNVILPDGYWWLAYDYKNFRLSCQVCNEGGAKVDYFPIKPGTLPAKPDEDKDENLLIDPCVKADTELIGYDDFGEVFPLTSDAWEKERVEKSAEIYKLHAFTTDRKALKCRCKDDLEMFEMAYEDGSKRLMEKAINNLLRDIGRIDAPTAHISVAQQYILKNIKGKAFADVLLESLGLSDHTSVSGISDAEVEDTVAV